MLTEKEIERLKEALDTGKVQIHLVWRSRKVFDIGADLGALAPEIDRPDTLAYLLAAALTVLVSREGVPVPEPSGEGAEPPAA